VALGLALLLVLAVVSSLGLNMHHDTGGGAMPVTKEQALAIADADAAGHYRDLSRYAVTAEFDGRTWHVDYDLKDPALEGGGPHYIISGADGTILQRRYEQ
jgi:hypothetical protein